MIPIKFNTKPVLDMSMTFSLLVPKIMAFGAVAAGNIKARDAAIVAGSINNNGFSSRLMAKPAITGKKVSTVATFDVSSVKNVINVATAKIINKGWTPFNQIN